MAKVVTSFGNFVKGRLDHDMMGRFDLPLYNTGMDIFENFISNFKGNAIYSAGFISQLAFQDCEFIEFKFGTTQNYLCLFYANKIRFLAFDTNGVFGWVLDGIGNILEVATPYTLAECRQLDYTQNNDVMVVTIAGTNFNYEPRKLIRVNANSFTFNVFARLNDPFATVLAGGIGVNAITQANPAAVTTAAPHGLATGFRVKFTGATGMTQINNYTARVTVTGATTFTIDIDTTTFGAYTGGGQVASVISGDYPACCLFYKGRLYYAATPSRGTKVWFSTSGVYDDFTIPVTATDSSAFNFIIADITQKIEWLYPGDNSLVVGSSDGIVAVNGGGVNTSITASSVEANITTAPPTSGAYPISKDGLVFYVGVTGRNIHYFKYDIIGESFLARDANLVSYDITKTGLLKLRAKRDRNDLIFAARADGALVSLTFKDQPENINGWHERTTGGSYAHSFEDIAVIGDNLGNPRLIALTLRNGTYYIEMQSDYVEFAQRDRFINFSDDPTNQAKYRDMDNEAYARYVGEQLRECTYLDNALRYQDLRSTTLTFTPLTYNDDGTPATGTIGASAASFVIGDIGKHISYKTLTGYESGRFEITGYTNDTTVSVSVLQNPKTIFEAPLYTWSSWYKSFTTISGLSQYNGTTVGVCVDGGYLASYSISGGSITFDRQVTSIVFGYLYTGIIKSFCLGFQVQGTNTQTTLKNLTRVGMRTVASAGGKIGTSLYHLEDVQELSQNDLNYLPPLPIDGTKYVDYTDDSQEDKYFYIVQDQPLPLQIACTMLEANYSTSS